MTDPHPVADDPSGIVQQMPEIRFRAEGRCSTDSTMRQFAYAVMVPDPDGGYVEYEKARATEADLRAEVERLLALAGTAIDQWESFVESDYAGTGMYDAMIADVMAARAALSSETDGGQDG